MKKYHLIALLCLITVSCTTKTSTITLEIKNAGSGDFYLLLPTDDIASIAVDTIHFNGDTLITMPVKCENGLIYMSMFGQKLKNIETVCGDGDFTIIYNPADTLSPISYSGTNEKGRALLQTIAQKRDKYQYEWVRNYSAYPLDTIGSKMVENFKELASADISKFDSLHQQGAISKQFYDYVKLDAELYHTLSIGKVVRSDWGNKNRDPKKMQDGYAELWDAMFEKLPVSSATYRTSTGIDYASLYIDHYGMFCDSKKSDAPTHYNSTLDYYNNYTLPKIDSLLKDEQLKRAYISAFLFSEVLNNKTRDSSIVKLLDKFSISYPTSGLNSYFNTHKEEINTYYKKIDSADISKVHFVEDSDKITTLNDLLSQFKGRKLFVDFWFSTCGPCLKEFEHSTALKNFLDEKGVDILYVSIDRPNRENAWINAIKFNSLYGNHIRVSQTLHEDIYNVHGISLFPTYMIVDEKGKVVVPRAKYPSTGSELLDQLTETLNL